MPSGVGHDDVVGGSRREGGRRRGELVVIESNVDPVAATPPTVIVVGSTKSVPETVKGAARRSGPGHRRIEKMIRCENSEVLPAGSVAVAAMRAPASVATGKSHVDYTASPMPSVVTCDEPR